MRSTAFVKRRLPDAPEPTRAVYKKPVQYYDPKHMVVVELPPNLPKRYEFPEPDKGRTERIQKSLEKTRKERKKVSPRVWTPDKVERLKSLYTAGKTQQAIADEIGMSKTAVNAEIHILQEKGELPKTRDQRPWTDAEVTELRRLRAKGLSFDECGKRLGRHPASCSGVIRRRKQKC